MKVEFELWHLISLLLTLTGLFVAFGRSLLAQFSRRIDERLLQITKETERWHEMERLFNDLRAELPKEYLRREDYIRGQTVIEAKLDFIAEGLKNVQIQGARKND